MSRWVWLACGLTLLGCAPRAEPPGADGSTVDSRVWTDTSHHQVRLTPINGIRISYLDWGGSGDGLIFVHGMEDSPHAFDDLAPSFTDRFRVIAYARRGHGRSDAPAGPYDIGTLVEDLRQLLDSLGIDRANLVGWSMGGNEVTEFAAKYPDRIGKVVYLDAGYDWSDPRALAAFGKLPVALAPDSAATRSVAAFRTWQKANLLADADWTPAMEAQIRDVIEVATDGSVSRPTDSLMPALITSVTSYRAQHSAVKAPALAIYAERFLHEEQTDSSVRTQVKAWNISEWGPFAADSRRRLEREMPGILIVMLPGTSHVSLPFQARERMVAEIRQFLLGGPP